jgi:hypothetical protein
MAGAATNRNLIDPDASSYDVMAIYGALMLEVQTMELAAAALSLLAELDPDRTSRASLARQLDAAFRKSRHAFRRGSLSASRDRLRGRIDEKLLVEIDELLAHRNRLAHRFLLERMITTEGGARFRPGTALEIVEYERRFKSTGEKIQEEAKRRTRGLPGAPEDLETVLDRFARSIVFGGDVSAGELAGPGPPSPQVPGYDGEA